MLRPVFDARELLMAAVNERDDREAELLLRQASEVVLALVADYDASDPHHLSASEERAEALLWLGISFGLLDDDRAAGALRRAHGEWSDVGDQLKMGRCAEELAEFFWRRDNDGSRSTWFENAAASYRRAGRDDRVHNIDERVAHGRHARHPSSFLLRRPIQGGSPTVLGSSTAEDLVARMPARPPVQGAPPPPPDTGAGRERPPLPPPPRHFDSDDAYAQQRDSAPGVAAPEWWPRSRVHELEFDLRDPRRGGQVFAECVDLISRAFAEVLSNPPPLRVAWLSWEGGRAAAVAAQVPGWARTPEAIAQLRRLSEAIPETTSARVERWALGKFDSKGRWIDDLLLHIVTSWMPVFMRTASTDPSVNTMPLDPYFDGQLEAALGSFTLDGVPARGESEFVFLVVQLVITGSQPFTKEEARRLKLIGTTVAGWRQMFHERIDWIYRYSQRVGWWAVVAEAQEPGSGVAALESRTNGEAKWAPDPYSAMKLRFWDGERWLGWTLPDPASPLHAIEWDPVKRQGW